MIGTASKFIAAACAAVLAGCSAQLDEARRSAPAASAFEGALQTGYIRLARAELDELDLIDADSFANRAVRLSHGETVLPEPLDARRLPAAAAEDLAGARARLIAALDGGGRERAPWLAAEAQLRFDCWMQEQEENFQPDDIAGCRNAFLAAVEKVETATPALVKTRAPALRPTTVAADASKPSPLRQTFTVTFGFDSARIDTGGTDVIAGAVASYMAYGTAIVRIDGHSDRAGTEAYNMKLARERADAVARAMNVAGVPADVIRIRSFGESRPLVPTVDGRRDDRNRRVEIGIDPRMPRTATR